MMGKLRHFSMDIHRAFFSLSFLMAPLGICFIYFTGAWIDIKLGGERDVLILFHIAKGIGGFTTMTTLFCVLPYTSSFCDDWNSKYARFCVIRSNLKVYGWSKVISCTLAGGGSIALGILLFILILAFKFPLVSAWSPEYQTFMTGTNGIFLLHGWYGLYFFTFIYSAFWAGAFWAVLGLSVSAYLPNKFVALTAPFISFYVIRLIMLYTNMPPWMRLDRLGAGSVNIGTPIMNLAFVTLVFITLIIGLGFAFVNGIDRRLTNG